MTTQSHTLPRIDFYLLSHEKTVDTLNFTCRLSEKAFRTGHTLYILTSNHQESILLDKLLWSFRADSFVPHCVQSSDKSVYSPIIIGEEMPKPQTFSALVNLTGKVIRPGGKLQRVFHIIPKEDISLEKGRQAFKAYRSRGLTPKIIRL